MSQASSGFPQQQHGASQGQQGTAYIPTEDEKRVFRECNQESFWYRSLPFSAMAAAVTQVLITRGVVVPSPRFGSVPKVAIAGLLGYMGGKMSYMKVCQEKFKNLENSPLGAALRQGKLPRVQPELNQSELGDTNQTGPSYEQTTDFRSQPDSFSNSGDYSPSSYEPAQSSYEPAPFSSGLSESAPSGARDDIISQAPPYLEDDAPKRKATLYEDLRSKNRENYEVTLTQKAETLLKPQSEVVTPTPAMKKNQYGDAWDE